MSVTVEGLKDLQQQLLDLGAEIGQKVLAAAARKAMVPVLNDAKALCPKDSGALADSITLTATKPKEGDAVAVAGLKIGSSDLTAKGELPPARRWHFVELGTSKMAAHPFLRPALDRQASTVLDVLKVELQAGIQRAIKRAAK